MLRGIIFGWRSAALSPLVPLFFIVVSLDACQVAPETVKIGLVAPFEGADRALGYDAIYAARLAIREINDSGGIDGVMITLVALDDRGQEDLAQAIARSLVIDPEIVGVVGHGLSRTTAAAQPVYRAAELSFLPLGQAPFSPFPENQLPPSFKERYQQVTPFEESAGVYAGPAYDAVYLLAKAMTTSYAENGRIDREGIAFFLPKISQEGITGTLTFQTLP